MTLIEIQQAFTKLVAALILYAHEKGYGFTFGEALRPPELAKLYAKQGKGIRNSLHCIGLAIDLNLFKNNQYLDSTEAHRPLGEYWESLARPGLTTVWGGRFKKPDGNHYSIEYQGRK